MSNLGNCLRKVVAYESCDNGSYIDLLYVLNVSFMRKFNCEKKSPGVPIEKFPSLALPRHAKWLEHLIV